MPTDVWGIDSSYIDAREQCRDVPQSTVAALRASMGGAEQAAPLASPVRLVAPGASWVLPGDLILEDGTQLTVDRRLPADLPFGYHRFIQQKFRESDQELRLICSPGRCHLPTKVPGWGWAIQLYATRSRGSWGIGDLADLSTVARWSSALGASVLLTSPLHAAAPLESQQASPYYPSSRRFRNPLYLRVENVPGAERLAAQLEPSATVARALNEKRRIDRPEVFRHKMKALEQLWTHFPGDPDFEAYCNAEGASLRLFAVYCVLAEHYGSDWRRWSAEYRSPGDAAVAQFAAQHARRVQFHQWLQWLLDQQLAAASRPLAVIQDLPIGVDPGGADAWVWRDILAQDVSVGAPPDLYNTRGQDWGLPPWIPHRLRAVGYEPFIETIRATLRHAGGLRIDHALGLFRLFWIPAGEEPARGAFVRYPYDELLAIVALESQRAQAFIVGEDLGTVEPIVSQQLARHDMLSYRVMWFEEERPRTYPRGSLAAITTHDLPTVAGLWSGDDVLAQRSLNMEPNEEGLQQIRNQLQAMTGLENQAPLEQVSLQAHALLAESNSMLVTATLDDALVVRERPNMPATVDAWPNWSIALPQPLEEFQKATLVQQIARELNARTLED